MGLIYDTNEVLKNSKRDIFISGLMRLATKNNNRSGAVILKNAGLSSYVEQWGWNLSPYSYNGQWENSNVRYAPERVFDYFYNEIGQDDKEHQFLFLKAIVEQIKVIDYDDLEFYNRHLATLGYEIIESNSKECAGYTLKNVSITIVSDSKEITVFEEMCNKVCPGSFNYFNEAISTFRNSDYSSCVSNCRKLLEAITTKISGETNVSKAIFALSGEEFDLDDGQNYAHDCNQAINYWSKKEIKCLNL